MQNIPSSVGVLDGRRFGTAVKQTTFTHNPYWYEGFSLSPWNPSAHSQPVFGAALRGEERCAMLWSPYVWPERRVGRGPVKGLRSTNLKFLDMENRRRGCAKNLTPIASDNSSDHTLGYSDSERSDRDQDEKEAQLEARLIQCIIEYFGDCKGSLPSERVQNVIKKDYPELYEQVVVARFRKKWHKFLQHCSDTFQLFTRPAQPAPNQDYCWRIRLVNNADWEEADLQEEEFRAKRDQELLDKVHAILLNSPDTQCSMIDVINELNKDLKSEEGCRDGNEEDDASADFDSHTRKARKIRAGDLKRLMRKANSNFTILEYQDAETQKRTTYMKLLEASM